MNQFVAGLKSRSEETRVKAACDLQRYVTTELREVCHSGTVETKFDTILVLILVCVSFDCIL